MAQQKHRLITRSDFDGLVCAVILKEVGIIDDIKFVHPKDMQDGLIQVTEHDITTNLPYVPGVHLAFDHHFSETLRNEKRDNHIIDPKAPSAARVVYDYFGGAAKLTNISTEMMEAVDKGDSAQFSRDEILKPEGWVLLNFLMDARTGLGRFRNFTISNYQLMMELIDYCRNHSIEQIINLPHVKERVDLYFDHEPKAKQQIMENSKLYGDVVILNLKDQDPIYATNRFLIYALYPQAKVSIHVMWGFQQQNTVLAVGKSILDRSSKVNVGELMLKYGGGGHEAAGTCQVDHAEADKVLNELVEAINTAS